MGDGEFVNKVLADAEEKLQKKYQMKAAGYDLEKLTKRVSEITGLSTKEILDSQRDKKRTEARSILCFWAKEALGTTTTQTCSSLESDTASYQLCC